MKLIWEMEPLMKGFPSYDKPFGKFQPKLSIKRVYYRISKKRRRSIKISLKKEISLETIYIFYWLPDVDVFFLKFSDLCYEYCLSYVNLRSQDPNVRQWYKFLLWLVIIFYFSSSQLFQRNSVMTSNSITLCPLLLKVHYLRHDVM